MPLLAAAVLVASSADAERHEPRPTEDPLLYTDTELTSPAHRAATPGGADLPPSAVPEGYVSVDFGTMDPSQLLQVRAYDLEGNRIGSLTDFLPEGAEAGAIEAAVIEHGGVLGLLDDRTVIPLEGIAVLADADGNGLRVVVAQALAD